MGPFTNRSSRSPPLPAYHPPLEPAASLDDYLAVLDRIFREAKEKGAVCLKTTLAYERTLRFENVLKDQAARVFGRRRSELTAAEVKRFEDYVMWRLVGLSAKYDLPFQIHTGQARIQGSNPMLLVDLIEANPKTKFVLFHGGYPWVGETGVIVMRYGSHVWIDSCWLPTLSYTTAKRAYHEWLEAVPSNRILWGADCKRKGIGAKLHDAGRDARDQTGWQSCVQGREVPRRMFVPVCLHEDVGTPGRTAVVYQDAGQWYGLLTPQEEVATLAWAIERAVFTPEIDLASVERIIRQVCRELADTRRKSCSAASCG
jgi:hypothetical protein